MRRQCDIVSKGTLCANASHILRYPGLELTHDDHAHTHKRITNHVRHARHQQPRQQDWKQ